MNNYKLPSKSILGIKVIKYRIVTDNYAGYECQKWRLWFPFWVQMDGCNTNLSVEQAIKHIEKDGNIVLPS